MADERFPSTTIIEPAECVDSCAIAATVSSPLPTMISMSCGPASRTSDLSTICGSCYREMRPEGAHYRCDSCGWRDSCCEGIY